MRRCHFLTIAIYYLIQSKRVAIAHLNCICFYLSNSFCDRSLPVLNRIFLEDPGCTTHAGRDKKSYLGVRIEEMTPVVMRTLKTKRRYDHDSSKQNARQSVEGGVCWNNNQSLSRCTVRLVRMEGQTCRSRDYCATH